MRAVSILPLDDPAQPTQSCTEEVSTIDPFYAIYGPAGPSRPNTAVELRLGLSVRHCDYPLLTVVPRPQDGPGATAYWL
jgi:hypothetical protein